MMPATDVKFDMISESYSIATKSNAFFQPDIIRIRLRTQIGTRAVAIIKQPECEHSLFICFNGFKGDKVRQSEQTQTREKRAMEKKIGLRTESK